jgi:hypothetical protein
MAGSSRKIDLIDKMTLPIFAATMVWEHRVLKKRLLTQLHQLMTEIQFLIHSFLLVTKKTTQPEVLAYWLAQS